jgi:hypothetical protein
MKMANGYRRQDLILQRARVTLLALGLVLPTIPHRGSAACIGDCDSSGDVTVNEIITMVNIALGSAPVANCAAGDADNSGDITINEIIAAVNNALSACPPEQATPTATATASPIVTASPTITASPTVTATDLQPGLDLPADSGNDLQYDMRHCRLPRQQLHASQLGA